VVPNALSRTFTEVLSVLGIVSLVDMDASEVRGKDYESCKAASSSKAQQVFDVRISNGFIYRRVEHTSGEKVSDESCWMLWLPKELVSDLLKKKTNEDP